ncbi:SPASM domain-containing protein [Litoribacter ruber]|uniref:radical SAM/SPASM domain-containing protein n=1 Tax=Litoribacter ruber TaxID=702568 RepID=UPI001BDAE216|nr:radical SAM/SPASM domain-containing protein [Litoribacter ruber]MBT0812429.1 SPASM domain-containing protein [Litoribacter ruber]
MNSKIWIGRAFLGYLTWGKVYNYLLLVSSFQLSRRLGKPKIMGLPTSLSIEPTTSCNLRCPECPSGLRSFSRATGMLDEELFKSAIDQMKGHLSYLHLYFQGEPYLHPNFLDLVKYADSHKIFTATSTNAHYLTPKNIQNTVEFGLKQLIVSVDGTSQEIYQNYRIGGKLAKVTEGIQNLIAYRNKAGSAFPQVILQFLVTGVNEHQLPDIKKLAAQLQVDELQLKTTQIYDYENGSPLIPVNNLNYSRYVPTGGGTWQLKNKMENKCWRMWQGAVMTWDGNIVPCCFDKDAKYVMGSLKTEKMSSIWNKPLYNSFRKQLLRDRSQIDICQNCTE